MKLKIPAILAATFGLLSSAYLALGLYEHKSHAAAPTGGTIAGLYCEGYGFYTGGATCPQPPGDGAPVLMFSDLTYGSKTGWDGSATEGAVVTVWGRNLGTEGTRGTDYVTVGGVNLTDDTDYLDTWAETSNPVPFLETVTFQLNSSMADGNTEISVTVGGVTSNVLNFTIGAGAIYFVAQDAPASGTDGSLANPYDCTDFVGVVNPGDVVYFRGGNYVDKCNGGKSNIWYRDTYTNGTASQPIALGAYPNEVPLMDGITNGDTSNFNKSMQISANYVTLFKMTGYALGPAVETQGDYVRIVGNNLQGATQFIAGTGIIIGSQDGNEYIGNATWGARSNNRLDHAIYLNSCSPNVGVKVGYNWIYDNQYDRGPSISINHQETRCPSNVALASHYVYNNVIDCTNFATRGIGVFDLSWDVGEAQEPDPTYVYNNILINCGTGGYAAMYHNNGHAEFFNNTLFGLQGNGFDAAGGGVLSTKFINNVIQGSTYECVDGLPSSLDNNAYFGGCVVPAGDLSAITSDPKMTINVGTDTYDLAPDSPLIDAGSVASNAIVNDDFLGRGRNNTSIDVGALEDKL